MMKPSSPLRPWSLQRTKKLFDYNMNGGGIGSLDFLVNGNSLWNDGTNHGDVWKTVEVDLSAYTGIDVILEFQGLRGSSWQGDIAIDNVRFVPLSTVPVPMPMPMPPPTVPVLVPGPPGPPGPAGPPGPVTM